MQDVMLVKVLFSIQTHAAVCCIRWRACGVLFDLPRAMNFDTTFLCVIALCISLFESIVKPRLRL